MQVVDDWSTSPHRSLTHTHTHARPVCVCAEGKKKKASKINRRRPPLKIQRRLEMKRRRTRVPFGVFFFFCPLTGPGLSAPTAGGRILHKAPSWTPGLLTFDSQLGHSRRPFFSRLLMHAPWTRFKTPPTLPFTLLFSHWGARRNSSGLSSARCWSAAKSHPVGTRVFLGKKSQLKYAN